MFKAEITICTLPRYFLRPRVIIACTGSTECILLSSCAVGAFARIGRDECSVLLLSFCSANMTPDLPQAYMHASHTLVRALIETIHD